MTKSSRGGRVTNWEKPAGAERFSAGRAEINKGSVPADVKDRFCELNEKRRGQPKP